MGIIGVGSLTSVRIGATDSRAIAVFSDCSMSATPCFNGQSCGTFELLDALGGNSSHVAEPFCLSFASSLSVRRTNIEEISVDSADDGVSVA